MQKTVEEAEEFIYVFSIACWKMFFEREHLSRSDQYLFNVCPGIFSFFKDL